MLVWNHGSRVVLARFDDNGATPSPSRLEQHVGGTPYSVQEYAGDFRNFRGTLARISCLRLDAVDEADSIRPLLGQIESMFHSLEKGTQTPQRRRSPANAPESLRTQDLALLERVFSVLTPQGVRELANRVDALDAALTRYAYHAHELVDRGLRDRLAETAARFRYLARIE